MSTPAQLHGSDAEARFFYSDEQNQPVGPFPLSELRRLAANGMISGETYVIEEQGVEWKPYAVLATTAMATAPKGKQETGGRKGSAPRGPVKAWILLTICSLALLAVVGALIDGRASRKPDLAETARSSPSLPITESTRFLARGSTMYADEDSIREANVEHKEISPKPTPGDSPDAIAKRLHDLYPKDFPSPSNSGPILTTQPNGDTDVWGGDFAKNPDGPRAIAAWNRLSAEGKIWSERFDFPVKVLKTGGAMQSALVEPLQKGITRRPRFWVLERELHSMNDPVARVWKSRKTVRQKDFAFTFTGHNRTKVGGVKVGKLADMLTGIYDGKISPNIAPNYLFEPGAISARFSNAAGDYFIYEVFVSYGTSFSPERYVEFALRRDGLDKGGPLALHQATVIVTGTQEFTTGAGIVRVIPVVEVVNALP